jgi:hypothetical protein
MNIWKRCIVVARMGAPTTVLFLLAACASTPAQPPAIDAIIALARTGGPVSDATIQSALRIDGAAFEKTTEPGKDVWRRSALDRNAGVETLSIAAYASRYPGLPRNTQEINLVFDDATCLSAADFRARTGLQSRDRIVVSHASGPGAADGPKFGKDGVEFTTADSPTLRSFVAMSDEEPCRHWATITRYWQ